MIINSVISKPMRVKGWTIHLDEEVTSTSVLIPTDPFVGKNYNNPNAVCCLFSFQTTDNGQVLSIKGNKMLGKLNGVDTYGARGRILNSNTAYPANYTPFTTSSPHEIFGDSDGNISINITTQHLIAGDYYIMFGVSD